MEEGVKMNNSRRPEYRGSGGDRHNLLLGLFAAIVFIFLFLVFLYSIGVFGLPFWSSEKSEEIADEVAPISTPVPLPTITPMPLISPTTVPTETPTPILEVPELEIETLEPTPIPTPVLIDSDPAFGRVVKDGLMKLTLPEGDFDSRYVLQVDSGGNFTLRFNVYGNDGKLSGSVILRNYKEGDPLKRVEMSIFYEDGSVRKIRIEDLSISVEHIYELHPLGPSLFSEKVRKNTSNTMGVRGVSTPFTGILVFDVTGYSGVEGVREGKRLYTEVDISKKNDLLLDLDELVRQIEEDFKK
ncbi:MAG: hypothetical protein A3B96_03120 [Candidatus Spechtbacteria bacterium RIFCSPHIGHO2_02_FULL_43_15b]|nr:MAG: hypothetical protein A3B96_03120 [Candidatus Spechtbacteria bacterium RIFCSPHIGHO2_02_FULL_43_15b]